MMNEVRFADLLDQVQKMDKNQLLTLADACATRIEERQERFDYLCGELEKYLEAIFQEFPNSHIYLTHGNAQPFDILDCILPQNFLQKCEIGDWQIPKSML